MTNNYIESYKTIGELEAYRKSINEAIDNRENFIRLCNRASELGSKSFAFIKECFESMSPALFESAEGKKLIRKYASTIKGSTQLSNMHSLCENIRKADKNVDTTYFVNSLTECEWNVDAKSLAEDMEKLGRVLSEAYLYLGDKAEDYVINENKTLSNAIEYIAENKRTYKNITEYSSAVKVIKEEIEKVEGTVNMFESKSLDKIADDMILEFNKKYDSALDESEKALVREVATNSDKKTIFDTYKKNCLAKIEEKKEISKTNGNDVEFEKLASISEQVSKKSYCEDKFSEDVCSLAKMISVLG